MGRCVFLMMGEGPYFAPATQSSTLRSGAPPERYFPTSGLNFAAAENDVVVARDMDSVPPREECLSVLAVPTFGIRFEIRTKLARDGRDIVGMSHEMIIRKAILIGILRTIDGFES